MCKCRWNVPKIVWILLVYFTKIASEQYTSDRGPRRAFTCKQRSPGREYKKRNMSVKYSRIFCKFSSFSLYSRIEMPLLKVLSFYLSLHHEALYFWFYTGCRNFPIRYRNLWILNDKQKSVKWDPKLSSKMKTH